MSDAVDLAITDFAEHLVPEAFSAASSAYRVDLVPLPPRESAFAEWIERCRQEAVSAEYPFGGGPSGVVYVRRGDERWRWDQDSCCELRWLADRINDEVKGFGDPWVFLTSLHGREIALERAGQRGDPATVQWIQPWYAEARSRTVSRIYSGLAELRGSEVVGRLALPSDSAFERAARRVLARHPARRRYRLR